MPATRLRIFVSSVQKEFAKVRTDLKAFLLGDAFLRRFVAEVFLFEELPARDQRSDEVYLTEVARSDIYLGLLGNDYGSEDAGGVSPTEREYDEATRLRKARLIYVWGRGDGARSPKMLRMIGKASNDLVRRRVEDESALRGEVYASLVDHLERRGDLRVPPFDVAPAEGASIEDLSRSRVDWFLAQARNARGFPLDAGTETQALLAHLNLLSGDRPTNAAVLLFGSKPQRFHRSAETKCVHAHGMEYQRPFGSQQNFEGDLFEQCDAATDFVLSKIDRRVGTRALSSEAPVTYELPPEAVREAIVNAVAHRDYHSNASVEVRLFVDRLEIWNPGVLPGTLSLQSLHGDHPSVPANPLIAEPLYLARYIEKVGSGTQKMIRLCREAGLPEPTFEERDGFFVVSLLRDWLTPDRLAHLNLNERQMSAVALLKKGLRLTNTLYQRELGVSKRTATRDLEDLMSKGLIERIGSTGKGVEYQILRGATKGPKGP